MCSEIQGYEKALEIIYGLVNEMHENEDGFILGFWERGYYGQCRQEEKLMGD